MTGRPLPERSRRLLVARKHHGVDCSCRHRHVHWYCWQGFLEFDHITVDHCGRANKRCGRVVRYGNLQAAGTRRDGQVHGHPVGQGRARGTQRPAMASSMWLSPRHPAPARQPPQQQRPRRQRQRRRQQQWARVLAFWVAGLLLPLDPTSLTTSEALRPPRSTESGPTPPWGRRPAKESARERRAARL